VRVKTGCNTYLDYFERGLRIALTFLAFEDEPVRGGVEFEPTFSDAPYVRRHSRDSLPPTVPVPNESRYRGELFELLC
jgi:hypothetical protein